MKTKKMLIILLFLLFNSLKCTETNTQSQPAVLDEISDLNEIPNLPLDSDQETRKINVLDIIKQEIPDITDAQARGIYYTILNMAHDKSIHTKQLIQSMENYAQEPTQKKQFELEETIIKARKKNPYLKKALDTIFLIILGGGGAYAYNKITSQRLTRAIEGIEGLTTSTSFDWIGLLKTGGIIAAGVTIVVVLVSIWVKIKRFIFGDSVNELKNAREYYKKTHSEVVEIQEKLKFFEQTTKLLGNKLSDEILPILNQGLIPLAQNIEDSSARTIETLSLLEQRVELLEKLNKKPLKGVVRKAEAKQKKDEEIVSRLTRKMTHRRLILSHPTAQLLLKENNNQAN